MKINLIIIMVLFSNTIMGQSTSIKDVQTFNQAANDKNVVSSGVTVMVYQSRYIFDEAATEKCNGIFSDIPGELKVVQDGEALAFVTKDNIYVFNDEMIFTNVSGGFLKYLKCWADSDPTNTVEIKN